MLLAIDVGNTQTVVGLYASDDDGSTRAELLDHWRIATNAERTSDEHALVVQEFLGFHGFSFDENVDGVAVSSVVPRADGRGARDVPSATSGSCRSSSSRA